MSEIAMRQTSGTAFVAVDAGTRIMAVRPDGGEAEIQGQPQAGGPARQLRIGPVERDLGWVTPPEDVVWTEFRAADRGATCFVELAPLGG
jgi:hypothetical protein